MLATRTLHGGGDPALLVVLILLSPIAGGMKVHLTVRWGRMTLGFAVAYFTLLVLGIPQAALVNGLAAVGGLAINRSHGPRRFGLKGVPWYQLLFNIANHVLSVVVGGVVYWVLGGKFGSLNIEEAALPVLVSSGAYYLVNTLGTATAVGWSQQLSALSVWRENFTWTAPGYFASSSVAALLVLFFQEWGAGVLFLFPPFYLIYYSYRITMEKVRSDHQHIARLNEMNHAVITSLAMAIDAKDRYTCSHVNRVREYAVAIARQLNLSDDDLEAIRIAALLHDIGKLGIPEQILSKPDRLTAEEFEIVKTHVTLGAMILEPVRFPWPVVPIVLAHHERWDGTGYPKGLAGEEIPIGGRIVAIADVFDALTSARPYRTAMTKEEAIAFIRSQSGRQFDPKVVEALVAVLPAVEERLRQMELLDEAATSGQSETATDRAEIVRLPTLSPEPRIAAEVLERISRSGEETLALYELMDLITARPDTETMLELIAAKVGRFVPHSTCVIYLVTEEGEELETALATGLKKELFAGMRIRVGEGVSGWVAARNELVMNASAGLDVARRLKPFEPLELSATLSVPLMGEGQAIGVLSLYHTGYNVYRPRHLRLLSLIAEHAGPALERARQFTRTQQLALEDSLTGLPNARALFYHLECQIRQSEREERSFVLLMADLDQFKAINDRWGHLEGDRVLRQVARRLQLAVRETDLVARYAGDEFVIVLPDTDPETAAPIVTRIRKAVDELCLGEEALSPGISIGQAVYPEDGGDPRCLLGAAGVRMYSDKAVRKGSVRGVGPPPEAGWFCARLNNVGTSGSFPASPLASSLTER